MDGTLIDLAPTPDAVVVASWADRYPGHRCAIALDGALAIVTGRPVETVDRLFGDAPGAVAGEHGGADPSPRPAPRSSGPTCRRRRSSWLEAGGRPGAPLSGCVAGTKARGFALHYRQVPEAKDVFYAAFEALVESAPGFDLHPAHMLWEIRPQGADKGGAVVALMQRPPFAGRAAGLHRRRRDRRGRHAGGRKLGGAGYPRRCGVP